LPEQRNSAEGVRWNLRDYYDGPADPRIDRDIAEAKRRAEAFEKGFRGRLAKGVSPKEMLAAVKEYEGIMVIGGKLLNFAYLNWSSDTTKPESGALLAKARERFTDVRKNLIFVELEWCALPDAKAKKLIEAPELAGYRHFLEAERRWRPHRLSEGEEKLMEAKGNTGRAAFVRLFDETLGRSTYKVSHKGETREVNLEEALSALYEPDREFRKAAHRGVTEGLKANVKTVTYLFNVLAQDHAVDDEFRRYKDMMSERNLQNEVDEKVVKALIDAVDRRKAVVARYYALKRRLLKLDKLYDYDRYAPIGLELPKCAYEDGKRITLGSFAKFSPKMREVALKFFDGNWIDAEMRPGKENGAYAQSGTPGAHPYILLNWTETMRDTMTMAHELGHGVHQYLAAKQGYLQQDASLATAETASVFGEMLVFEDILSKESDPKVKLGLVCGKVEDTFATVFRQIMMTRFERRFHEARRTGGELTPEQFNKMWKEENEWMFGGSVEMTEDYTWWWSYVLHFVHYNFYTYAYSFGNLLVLALYDRYKKEGPGFVERYMAMLEAGGSLAPRELVATVGLDIADPKFWDGGLAQIEELVGEAERLAKDAGMG
jgi:oligoendopeptidase F